MVRGRCRQAVPDSLLTLLCNIPWVVSSTLMGSLIPLLSVAVSTEGLGNPKIRTFQDFRTPSENETLLTIRFFELDTWLWLEVVSA